MKYLKGKLKFSETNNEIYLEKNIKSALLDIQNGDVISHEQLRKEVEEWK